MVGSDLDSRWVYFPGFFRVGGPYRSVLENMGHAVHVCRASFGRSYTVMEKTNPQATTAPQPAAKPSLPPWVAQSDSKGLQNRRTYQILTSQHLLLQSPLRSKEEEAVTSSISENTAVVVPYEAT
nr:hypothetical protein CFP56_34442 [Quercus suber]